MNEEQAKSLAARIKAQFPHCMIEVQQASDHSLTPLVDEYFVTIQRTLMAQALFAYDEYEWEQILLAYNTLRKGEQKNGP